MCNRAVGGIFVREGGFNKPKTKAYQQITRIQAPFRACPTLS